MAYSEQQQRIAKFLSERGNLSTVEYLLTLATESAEVEGQQWQDAVAAEPNRYQLFIPQYAQRNVWLLLGIEANAHQQIIEYLSVVRDLLAKKLVYILPDPKRHVRASAIVHSFTTPTVTDRDRSAIEIDALLQTSSDVLQLAIYTERVYALPALRDFIERGFKTTEEQNISEAGLLQQKQLSNMSKLSTRAVWIAGILGAVTLVALLWNIFFKREPALRIKSFSDTLNVRTQPTFIRDTLVVHDTVMVQPEPKQRSKKKKRRNRNVE